MDLSNLLSLLHTSGSRKTIYLSITPSVGLEYIDLDISTKTVKNYTFRPLGYNESLRQIDDVLLFKNALIDILSEMNINPKICNVVLNLPMVYFGNRELPLLLADDAITEALTSEVEQAYIFKRFEPLVSWADSTINQSGDSRKLFYTAIQKNIVDEIIEAVSDIGAKVISVQMSMTSLLKALVFSKLTEEQMKDNVTWNLMVVRSSGYSIYSMIGKNIVDYYEEPLAIKSFEGDEIYNAIRSSAEITLMSYPANYLFIISETELVSAELLSAKIDTPVSISFWEDNDLKKQSLIPVDLEVLEDNARRISLEIIGLASNAKLPMYFDFLNTSLEMEDPNEPVHVEIGTVDFYISPNNAKNIAFVIAGIIIIPSLLLFLILPVLANKKQAQLDELSNTLSQVEAKVKSLQADSDSITFNANSEISRVLSNNRIKLITYTALGESVPKKLWLTYFSVKDDGKIDIKGEASNVEDIYAFYRNLKDSLINTQLRIHKLEMKNDDVDVAVISDMQGDYTFELTNMTDAELSPVQEGEGDEKSPKNADVQAKDNSDKNNNTDNKNTAGSKKLPQDLPPAEDVFDAE